MCERRVAPAARLVRLELARPAAHVDRAADCRVALAMCGGDLLQVAIRAVQLRSGRVARSDLDRELGREVAELGQPEAVLVDEVEGKEVAAGRDRPANLELTLDPLARRRTHRHAASVPHDWVTSVV